MAVIHTYYTPASLAEAAAERIVNIAERAIAQTGRFVIALAGGTTPRLTYELLSDERYQRYVNWSKAHFFWSDERCVPPTNTESNYRLAKRALLDQIELPSSQIHRIDGETAPQTAADRYEADLREFFSSRVNTLEARFDVLLLGMGADGHTASLFPGSAAVRETRRWVMPQEVEAPTRNRITLTPAAINGAKLVMFLVSGADKAHTLKRVLFDPPQPDLLPAQVVQPTNGEVIWMLDEAAASQLRQPPAEPPAELPAEPDAS
jgi:6-phosphogluconolactonase